MLYLNLRYAMSEERESGDEEKGEIDKLKCNMKVTIFLLLSKADFSFLGYHSFLGARFVLGNAMPKLYLSLNGDFYLFIII